METQDIFDTLTENLGGYLKEVTGRKIILGKEGVWNKPAGEFILVDLQSMDSFRWETAHGLDSEGQEVYAHNYLVTYLITSFRGQTHTSLAKVLQRFKTPHIYYKYFPTNSPFAFSSSSTISRTRVPMEEQKFENQSSVILNFNVCFSEIDSSFEEMVDINIDGIIHQTGREDLTFRADINNPESDITSSSINE